MTPPVRASDGSGVPRLSTGLPIRCSCGWEGTTWEASQVHLLSAQDGKPHSIAESVRVADESIDSALARYEDREARR